ncbi:MAG: hypothetical protein ACQ9MH_25580, partial [Nitrospinales bacterium]
FGTQTRLPLQGTSGQENTDSHHFYFDLKNLILPRVAGFSMGQACPALRGILFFLKIIVICVYLWKSVSY